MSSPSPEVRDLQRKLSITPKTATLLIKSGYQDYRTLAKVSPETVAKQFSDELQIPEKHAVAYKRALRRIIWLGTQEHPEKHPKDCKNWSNKALTARGVFCTNFDELTGEEMGMRLKEASRKKTTKKF
ncbi:hypothetical protein AA313_de0209324 [Arthrobotrys entomopaga]|nr:hypothetical protein AA313_de0209324 [Arthrobotrys entomopaga]